MALQELKVTGESEIGVKRFYVDVELKTKCPQCGKGELDFNSNYFSYPTLNAVEEAYSCCNECDTEFYLPVKIKMSLEVDFDEIRKD